MYLITEQNVLHYLNDIGLVPYQTIFNQSIKIINVGSRNYNLIFEIDGKDGYFIKQNKIFERDFISSIQVEAQVYRMFSFTEELHIKDLVPSFVYYDGNKNTLITRYEKNATNFQSFINARQSANWKNIAQRQGDILACLHWKTALPHLNNFPLIKKKKPWAFELAENNSQYTPRNEIGRQIIQILKDNKNYIAAVRNLFSDYNTTHLIHSDIKFSNFLLNSSNSSAPLKLIDWEIASIGDPAWDLAGIWQSYIWQIFYAANTVMETRENAQLEFFDCIRRCWQAYQSFIPENYNKDVLLNDPDLH